MLGQNVNAYRGEMDDGDIADLALLIHYVAAIDGIDRIRYTTSHPVEFSDNLIDAYATVPELVNHLHLPVQSGSDRILSMMKRGHSAIEYKHKINKLRKIRPDISLSSDFIIGFPGETDADFNATMKLIDDIGFDTSFSFIYSARPGTPAAFMPDDVEMETKKQRLQQLQEKLLNQATRSRAKWLAAISASWSKVIRANPIRELAGRTENNRVVNFVGPDSLIGQFARVDITQALNNSLKGILAE